MGRRRQSNVEGGRTRIGEVWASPEQAAAIRMAAAEQQVSPGTFATEAAVAVALSGDELGELETPTGRRRRIEELFAVRHQLAEAALQVRRVGVNVNQIAHGVHTGAGVPVEEMREFLREERDFLARSREIAEDLDDLIDELRAKGIG
jgi:hypothetical protein